MKLSLVNWKNEAQGDVKASPEVFGCDVRKDILHRVVNWQLAKRRSGCHKTKTVSEIRGSTAKPFRQKGTGRARQGTRYAVQMRGGAVSAGPVVRSHAYSLNKKVRKLGLKIAVSLKAKEGNLLVIESSDLKSAKTKDLHNDIKGWLGTDSLLLIGGESVSENFRKASSNIVGVNSLPIQGANVYDILKHKYLFITKEGLEKLTARLS